MTVSTEVNHNEYTGNGVTTTFPYAFRIFQASDLLVITSDTNATLRTLTLDTDYTVSGVGSYSGGTVILSAPLGNGCSISIERDLPVIQETDLRNQGKFFAEVHEDALDKLTMLIQQVWSGFSLALRKPSTISIYYDALTNKIRNLGDPVLAQDAATKNYTDSVFGKTLRTPDSVFSLPSISDRANKVVAFDSVGSPVVITPPSGSATDVLLQLTSDEDGKGDALVKVKQPFTGAISRTQHSKNAETVSVTDFMDLSTRVAGTTDDTSAFKAAYNYISENGLIDIPPGVYVVGAITGTKNVVWNSRGGMPSSGIFNLPGVVWNRYQQSTIVDNSNPLSTGTAPLRVRKVANYTGGTTGWVNATFQADVEARAGGTSYEWAILGKLNSYRTSANASEDCASYFQATKNATGKVFGQVVELIDYTADPTVSSITQELDVRATGLDSNKNRIASHIVTTSTNGLASSIGYGIRFSPDSLAPIDKAISFENVNCNYLIHQSSFNVDVYGTVTTNRGSTSDSQYGAINFALDGVNQISLRAISASTFGLVLSNTLKWVWETGTFRPQTDATQNIASPSFRCNTVYASTGSINTSDERLKTFLDISDAEKSAAKEIKNVIRKFQFNDAVSDKGSDARYHFGVGAQTVRDILISHGLDAEKYAFFCHDTWDDIYEDTYEEQEVTQDEVCRIKQDDGTYTEVTRAVTRKVSVSTGKTLVKAAGDLYGIRYDELAMFMMCNL
ncbi:tail fiber domain-containing protein [Atlantibacter hermannii]|uniref:tail fiber domain-containing protein n=2 Tax=Atlantibacter hermannii TaxID=565 RepID=UPI0028A0139D|nr:hypothetical protein [Atlantibacter hermannii]